MAKVMTTEQARLAEDGRAWRRWGPYLAERAWGTVREDYSDGWRRLGLPAPRPRRGPGRTGGTRTGSPGSATTSSGSASRSAFWNGEDPILKERIFGLTGPQGNHGEDAKELWWYLDSTPTHSWMRWAYLYPQGEFPYGPLVAENGARGRLDPEFELVDTGALDGGRYWDITAEYAKAGPDDISLRIRVRNAGPDEATLHVLPTLWFRNTWSWGLDDRRPVIVDKDAALVAEHHSLGRMILHGQPDGLVDRLFCENESNARRLWDSDGTPYPKDGIGDHVVHGAATVNPDRTGTKAALWYRLTVAPGATAEVLVRLSADGTPVDGTVAEVLADREHDADEFYAALTPADAGPDEARVLRQAVAGMLWSKQFFHFDVDRWLVGDPALPAPPASRFAGTQPRVAPPQQRRRDLDARHVGVPVVRGVGPRLPLRAARPRRPAVRQGPAAPAVPGVVHAPERPAARLRVELQRRQPSRPRVGCAPRLRARRFA